VATLTMVANPSTGVTTMRLKQDICHR